jgi:hypothetical protein
MISVRNIADRGRVVWTDVKKYINTDWIESTTTLLLNKDESASDK